MSGRLGYFPVGVYTSRHKRANRQATVGTTPRELGMLRAFLGEQGFTALQEKISPGVSKSERVHLGVGFSKRKRLQA